MESATFSERCSSNFRLKIHLVVFVSVCDERSFFPLIRASHIYFLNSWWTMENINIFQGIQLVPSLFRINSSWTSSFRYMPSSCRAVRLFEDPPWDLMIENRISMWSWLILWNGRKDIPVPSFKIMSSNMNFALSIHIKMHKNPAYLTLFSTLILVEIPFLLYLSRRQVNSIRHF